MELYAPFRPRLARTVSAILTVLVLVGTVVLVVALPRIGPAGYSALDRGGIAVVGLGIVWFCYRQASVRALVDEEGVVVRNLATTRRVAWPEVVSVRFGQGRPWVQLDLADGDTLAVMGVQRSDGAFAEREARRMASLVALHSRTPRDD